MITIHFVDHHGTKRSVQAEEGATLMETALANNIPGIVAECGGAAACGTCHVYIDDAWAEAVGEIQALEEDILGLASDVRPNSRLSCQIRIRPSLEGLVAITPERQG